MSVPGASSRLVLHTESSLGFGGQEIRILTEARWLRQHGWDVLVTCQPASRLAAEAEAAGVPAVAISMRSALDVWALLALRRLMRARGVRLVHTHSSIDSWLATLAAKSLGLPVVRGRHVTIPVLRRRALVYRLADRIVTSGEAVTMLVARAGVPLDRIVAIPAGFDPARFHAGVSGQRVRQELALKGPAVGLVANVRGSKGHRYFLEAAREIVRGRPDARFLVVGDGVGFADVRRQVQEMGLGSSVIMTGFRRDIPEVMAALDVLVLPSTRSEAVSQVILQALAVGTPVVGTTVGGTPEVVRDGENGRLVPPADGPALATAILALLDDPARARAMGSAGQALVHARYSIDATMARTAALYAELLPQ
ncbi:MAG: glycosyltransferase family 4 protein [Candidatus Rokuibacteriota bacterium]